MVRNWLILIFIVFRLTSCIKPFDPELTDYEHALVVDALITNENRPYLVKLSYSTNNINIKPEMVTGASVIVTEENSIDAVFKEKEPGFYYSDSIRFKGKIGNTYTLYIRTKEGDEYRSEPSIMPYVPEIDSIYFDYDTEFYENGGVEYEGIRLYVDSHDDQGECKYYRWSFEEDWKFKVPYPALAEYYGEDNWAYKLVEYMYCWKESISNSIIIHSTNGYSENRILKKPITFIAPELTDKISVIYSILLKQYSLSKAEYDFWSGLQDINSGSLDIFEKQPYKIANNLYSINNPEEPVLGYFQVSGVTTKRKYIMQSDYQHFHLPRVNYFPLCEVILDTLDPELPTMDSMYFDYTSRGYVFYNPIMDFSNTVVLGMMFTKARCSDCRLTGNPDPPDFWIE